MGEVTSKICEKAWGLRHRILTEYMPFASGEKCLRFVLHPNTYEAMTSEFWEEHRQRTAGIHQGYWIEEIKTDRRGVMEVCDRVFGVKILTDESVPEGEVELRAVLAKSWGPVL